MDVQCSICLSGVKDPVCVPCGHMYCSECLKDHIAAGSTDGYTASCPTCRTVFPIVLPELACLPKPFHRYIAPSVRRVFLDGLPDHRLEEKLAASETQIRQLKRENDLLLRECERYMASSTAHAQGERDANQESEIWKQEASELEVKIEEMELEHQEEMKFMKTKYESLKRCYRELEADTAGLRRSQAKLASSAKRQKPVEESSADSEDEAPSPPVRRRVSRAAPAFPLSLASGLPVGLQYKRKAPRGSFL